MRLVRTVKLGRAGDWQSPPDMVVTRYLGGNGWKNLSLPITKPLLSHNTTTSYYSGTSLLFPLKTTVSAVNYLSSKGFGLYLPAVIIPTNYYV